MRRIAVVGDKLDNDGEICQYNGMRFTMGNEARQVTLINGAAYCPACETTGYIAKEGGPRRMTLGISEIALNGDVVVCDCAEPPRILAKLAGEAWYDDLTESLGTSTSRKTEVASALSKETRTFDEQVVLRSRSTGKRLAGVRYRARSTSGHIFEGTTDSAGLTQRIKTSGSESLRFEIAEY